MVLGLTEVSCRDQQIFGLSQISRVLCGSDERKKSSLTWINGSPAQAGGDVNLGMNALFCRYLGWDCQPLPTFPCRPELLFWIPLDTGVDGCLSQLALNHLSAPRRRASAGCVSSPSFRVFITACPAHHERTAGKLVRLGGHRRYRRPRSYRRPACLGVAIRSWPRQSSTSTRRFSARPCGCPCRLIPGIGVRIALAGSGYVVACDPSCSATSAVAIHCFAELSLSYPRSGDA
jgi:hypothetical protein